MSAFDDVVLAGVAESDVDGLFTFGFGRDAGGVRRSRGRRHQYRAVRGGARLLRLDAGVRRPRASGARRGTCVSACP